MEYNNLLDLAKNMVGWACFGWLAGMYLVGPAVALLVDKHTLLPFLNNYLYGRIVFDDYMEYIYFPTYSYLITSLGFEPRSYKKWKFQLFNVLNEDYYSKYINEDLHLILIKKPIFAGYSDLYKVIDSIIIENFNPIYLKSSNYIFITPEFRNFAKTFFPFEYIYPFEYILPFIN